MLLERGNMWDVFNKTGLFLITTNPIRRKDGAIVMGRGIALEAKKRFPSLPYDFAKAYSLALFAQDVVDSLALTQVGAISKYDEQVVGWFMTKRHWKSKSSLEIITESVKQLSYLANNVWSDRIDLNFPGIGNGKLRREDVLPIIAQLPDNVHVWEYE